MTSFEIREKFLKFFEKNQHKILPSSSLIPKQDPTLLFVNAGMNQFKNIFLGLETSKDLNVTTIQKCLRAGGKHNDIENVGETPWHHTFFEMMGSFSFGDYFKKRAIELAWTFLVQELRFSEDHLWVTIFKDDDAAYEIWKDHIKVPAHKILRLDEGDNFWQMGEVGPCGPCSEIHYYNGSKKEPDPEKDLIEIWNLVFMEFYDSADKKRQALPKPCVDTGMGLERLSSLVQKTTSNYSTDLFKEIIIALEKNCSYQYNFSKHEQKEEQMAFRVVADHSRALSFLISDGVLPGSEGSHYVLRRIMRRALYYSQKLHPQKPLLQKATEKVLDLMSPIYPNLKKDHDLILSCIEEENSRFSKSLEKGRKKLLEKMKSLPDPFVDFETAWDLYSTYGFPIDLTRLIVQEKNYKMIDEQTFEKEKSLLEKNNKLNKPSQKNQLEKVIQNFKSLSKLEETIFTGYKNFKETSSILFLFQNEAPFLEVQKLTKDQEGWLITPQTCFYPEGGGPIGDQGQITSSTGEAQVLDTLKKNKIIFHKVRIAKGFLEQNSSCELEVDKNFRSLITTSHTATHLLNASLRKHLGDKVRQAGSLVEPGYLRFDFTHDKPLTEAELQNIENEIYTNIQDKESVSSQVLPYQEAIQEGALSLKGENYADKVRVIRIGKKTSYELCGGLHVQNSQEIEDFKILFETGVQSGVRRILATTSQTCKKWEDNFKHQISELADYLKISLEKVKENPFLKWEEEQNKKINHLKNQIINLNSPTKPPKETKIINFPKNSYSRRHLLTQWNLELRKHLELPVVKDIESQNPFLDWAQKKQNLLEDLQKQFENLKSFFSKTKDLIKNSKSFQKGRLEGQLIIVDLPLKERKLLAGIVDQIKSKITSGVIVAIGDDEKSHPIVISVTKNLQQEISAGELLKKKVAPFLKGQGGGQKHFAQGSIQDKSSLSKLEEFLIQSFKETT